MLLREGIYEALRHAILTCALSPGQMLREEVLADQYGASRTPVRESLLRLEQDKLVTVLPRRGYVVRSITTADVKDMLHFRALIEPACAAEAARADDAAVQELDRFRGFAEQDFTEASFIAQNEALHSLLADLSANKRMGTLARELIQQFTRVLRVLGGRFNHELVRDSCAEHEMIIDAVQVHDADRASQLARAHIEGIRECIRVE